MNKCRLCDRYTENYYNINNKAKSICSNCGKQITIQEVDSLRRTGEEISYE